MYTTTKEKNVKAEIAAKKLIPLTPDEERKKASDARWDKAKRSSTEQSIMDAGRQENELKKR